MKQDRQGTTTEHVAGLRVRFVVVLVVVLAVVISVLLLRALGKTTDAYSDLKDLTERYITCELTAADMQNASDYLTTQARMFVITHDISHLRNYIEEATVTRRRENAVETLQGVLADETVRAPLEQALDYSIALMDTEYYAMKLIAVTEGYTMEPGMEPLADIQLKAEDLALSAEERQALATRMVYGDEYQLQKSLIDGSVTLFMDGLILRTRQRQADGTRLVESLLTQQRLLTVLFLVVLLITIALVILLILAPLNSFVSKLTSYQKLPMQGAYEMQYLANAYNTIFDENIKNSSKLKYEAEHDPLTGLYNRGAFETMQEAHRRRKMALMIVDVDNFKGFNDTYGHAMGDRVLKKVAALLEHSFRSSDYPCRIGGDEFAVIMAYMTPDLRSVIERKIEFVRAGLRDTSDGVPLVTLSIGVAFSTSPGDIFKNADKALYIVKENGRNGYGFYGPAESEGAELPPAEDEGADTDTIG